MGLAFPLSGVFFCCPAEDVLATCIFGMALLLVTMVGHETVAGVLWLLQLQPVGLYISSIGSF